MEALLDVLTAAGSTAASLLVFAFSTEGMWMLALAIWATRLVSAIQRTFRIALNRSKWAALSDGRSWWLWFSFVLDVFLTVFMSAIFRLIIPGVSAGAAGGLAGLILTLIIVGLPFQAKLARRRGAPA